MTTQNYDPQQPKSTDQPDPRKNPSQQSGQNDPNKKNPSQGDDQHRHGDVEEQEKRRAS